MRMVCNLARLPFNFKFEEIAVVGGWFLQVVKDSTMTSLLDPERKVEIVS